MYSYKTNKLSLSNIFWLFHILHTYDAQKGIKQITFCDTLLCLQTPTQSISSVHYFILASLPSQMISLGFKSHPASCLPHADTVWHHLTKIPTSFRGKYLKDQSVRHSPVIFINTSRSYFWSFPCIPEQYNRLITNKWTVLKTVKVNLY